MAFSGDSFGGTFLNFFPVFALNLFEKHRHSDGVWNPSFLKHCMGKWLVISTPLYPSDNLQQTGFSPALIALPMLNTGNLVEKPVF